MNNDFINNHSSMSSNMPIANQNNPQLDRFIQESYLRNKNKGVLDIQSKGNRTIFFDSDNEKRPSSQKDLVISKTVSKYPTNYAAGPNPYNDGIVQGYFVNNRGEPRFNQKTYQEPIREIDFERNEGKPGINYYRDNGEIGGDEVEYQNEGENEEDIEMQNANQFDDYSPQKAIGEYNEYIGDGIVRNNIPNYSPNQNVQNVPYYKKKNFNEYNMYNNYNRDYDQMNEMENENDQYDMESPTKNYNYNGEPYKRRHILGNLGDSASSEAYANNSNQIQKTPIIDPNKRIYVKPRSRVNILNLNGISTEERGIESRIESTNNPNSNMRTFLKKPYHYIDSEENELVRNKFNKNINYDEDSLNVVEPPSHSYNRDKGGKVDLNLMLKNRGRKSNREEKEEEREREIEEERDGEREEEREEEGEQDQGQEKDQEQDKEQEEEREQEEEEENEENGNNREDKEAQELKELFVTKIQAFWRGRSTRRIMTLYHDLDEFIYLLSKVHFNHFSDNFYFFINQLFNAYKANIDNNQNESLEEENENDDNIDNENNENNEFDEKDKIPDENENKLLNDYNELKNKYDELLQNNKDYKTTTKKTLNNNDIMSVPGETTFGTIKTDNQKFKKKTQNNELTFSNDYYNDEVEGNKHYYTPYQEDEDSFNEGSKEKRFSYSSIHSEENSKYFDNEQPAKRSTTGKRSITLNNRGNKNSKIGLLSLNKKKDNKLSYSPSSRGNSSKRNMNDGNQNENTINISIIQKNRDEFKSPIKSNYFDNNFMYPENENNLELIAKKKSDEQKINDILNNEKLFEKMKDKIGQEVNPKKYELSQNYGESFMIKNKKPIESNLDGNIKNNIQNNEIETNINNLEIIQNEHKNFVPSKLDLEFNEIFIGQDKSLLNKKRFEKIIPTSENEIFFGKNNKALFSNDKTLPSFKNDENNAFTIKNQYPKSEPKGSGFKPENILIDNISNSEFSINEPAKTEREANKSKDIEKEIIILPSKGKFVRLRRSKRTKETYFSIKPNKSNVSKSNDNQIILSKINESNFEIKSEYYYVETTDEPLPQIVEKKIIINEPSPNVNQFNNEKTILAHENDFNIKEEKNKKEYLEDIETNELSILSNRKSKKGKKENKDINKIEEFTINGEKKKWNELEFIPNEDFIIIKDYLKESEQSSNMGKEDEKNNDISFDIETNELEIIDKKKNKSKNKNKNNEDKKEAIIYKNEFRNIEPIQENEMFIMKMRKVRHRKNISVPMKENNINLNGVDILKEDKEVQIDPIREVKITTKKILKHEKILSRKKFLNNKKTLENSLSIEGIINNDGNRYKNNFDTKNLIKDSNAQVSYKKTKKNIKENETETAKEFDTLVPTANDIFNINRQKKKTKEEETEMDDDFINEQNIYKKNKFSLKTINSENISIKGKKRKKMVEEATEIGKDDFKFNINDNNKNNTIIKGDNLDIVVPKKEKKEIVLEKYNIDNITLESRNRTFPRLDMNKCLDQVFFGKENQIKNKELEYTQNEAITFEPSKNINNEEPSKEKEKQYIIENNQIFISQEENKPKKVNKDKKKKKMIESETQIDNDLIDYVKETNEEFEYLKTEPSKLKENKLFNDLEIYKCEPHEINEKEKEKIILENIKNESIMFEPHKKDIKYYIDYSNQFLIKTKKKKKENGKKSGFNELSISKCDDQNIFIKKKRKKKKKTKESETQIDDDLNNNENTQEENDSNKLRAQRKQKKEEKMKYLIDSNNQLNIKGHKKKKAPLKEEKKEDISYSPIKTNKLFSDLEMNKCEEKTINGKDKEPIILENIKNDSIEIKSKKNKTIDMETQIEKNDLQLDLVPENNDIFSLQSKKVNNIIVKNKRFIIKDEQKPKINGFDNLEQAFSENIEIKTLKEFENEEPIKVFDIANLSQIKEGSLEMKGKPEIKKEPEIDMGKINNMVQEKLEEEKHKNMDNTKNKLFKVLKAVKLKNALCKNTRNKKYFMDKLKEIKKNKDDKKILSFGNAININYLSSKTEKFESCTDTDYLDEMLDDLKKKNITIEKNNNIEIIEEKDKNKVFIPLIEKKDQFSIKDKKKRFKENETEITEELNRMEIESIKSLKFSLINNKDNDEEEEDEKDESKKSKKAIHRKNISISHASMSPRTYSESRENDLNISGISKDTVDKEVQIEPLKEFKITTKKIVKKELSTKKKFMNNKISNNSFSILSAIENKDKKEEKSESDLISNKKEKVETCDVMTQTPRLRPAKKDAQKVVFHEIKTIIKKEQKPMNKYEINHVNKLKFIGSGNKLRKKYKKRSLLKTPKESALNTVDNNDYNNKVYRIEKLQNFLKLFLNKKLDTLKLICFMKWVNLSKNEEITREDIKEIKNFFSKYHKIFKEKLLYFFDQYAKYCSLLETWNKIKNENNRKIYKKIKKYSQLNSKKENIFNSQANLGKKKLAFEKLDSILKMNAGKYFFSLYKNS